MAAHETFQRDEEIKGSSNRVFGFVIGTFFLLLGLAPLRHNYGAFRWGFIEFSVLFFFAGSAMPWTLGPLNWVWTRVAHLLQKVTNPLVMGVLFYLLITPVALVLKVLGKDPLNRRLDPNAGSYWIKRQPPGPAPETMRQQF